MNRIILLALGVGAVLAAVLLLPDALSRDSACWPVSATSPYCVKYTWKDSDFCRDLQEEIALILGEFDAPPDYLAYMLDKATEYDDTNVKIAFWECVKKEFR